MQSPVLHVMHDLEIDLRHVEIRIVSSLSEEIKAPDKVVEKF